VFFIDRREGGRLDVFGASTREHTGLRRWNRSFRGGEEAQDDYIVRGGKGASRWKTKKVENPGLRSRLTVGEVGEGGYGTIEGGATLACHIGGEIFFAHLCVEYFSGGDHS